MRTGNHITVRELIAQLKDLPLDAVVDVEGCDCLGPCEGAEIYQGITWDGQPDGTHVLIARGSKSRGE